MSEQITVRSTAQPCLVLTFLLVPVIILVSYVPIKTGAAGDLIIPACMIGLLISIYYYFYSLKLILCCNKIIYKVMWRSQAIPLNGVTAIERGRGPFGIGATWIIRSTDGEARIIANVTNFRLKDLREFSEALFQKIGIRALDRRL